MALIPSTWIGVIDEVRPRIMRMLNTLLPKILPKASCGLFLQAANTDVMSSGSEVPTATIVIEITASLMPQALARLMAESRKS